ncbi:MAG: heavy-metal-associated domain-containing protein [Bacteroidales bacterium]|nr:heavy-metal-associated domain-containing protein [Bacteroidales bacterium]
MKFYLKVLIVATFVALFSITAYAQDKNKKAKIEEVTFASDIDCPNCVKKVEANLPYEKGVKDLKVDLKEHTIYIKYDNTKTNKVTLADAIKKLGYSATEIVKKEGSQNN